MRGIVTLVVASIAAAGCGGDGGSADAAADAPTIDAWALTPLQAWDLAWRESDPAVRLALLEIAVSDEVRYVSPALAGGEVTGRSSISSVIGSFLATGGSTGVGPAFYEHNARLQYGWYVNDASGATTATGHDVVALATDGRMTRIVEFWDDAPPPGTLTPVQQAFLDAWNTPDAGQRAALLDTAVTDDVVTLLPPDVRGATRAELSEIVDDLFLQEPGRATYLRTGFILDKEFWYVDFETRSADDTVIVDGAISATVAGDGRIAEVVFFHYEYPPI